MRIKSLLLASLLCWSVGLAAEPEGLVSDFLDLSSQTETKVDQDQPVVVDDSIKTPPVEPSEIESNETVPVSQATKKVVKAKAKTKVTTKSKSKSKSQAKQQTTSKQPLKTSQFQVEDYVQQLQDLNRQKYNIVDDSEIGELLEQQEQLISDLLTGLRQSKTTNFIGKVNKKHLSFLNSKMELNKERGNTLAVERDRIELAYYQAVEQTNAYLSYLSNASKTYKTVNDVVNYSVNTLNQVKQEGDKIVLPETESIGKIYTDLEKNYHRYHNANGAFQDILEYVTINPGAIVKSFWFQRFSLISIISEINKFSLIKAINYKLAPFNLDVGGIVVSLIIITLVIICYPLYIRFISWFIDRYILDQVADHSALIIQELRKPLRMLLLFFSIDMATYALLYKTEYKASVEQAEFVIYAAIAAWTICKLLDTFFIIQVEKVAKRNKELRKELVNLGIQFAKVGVVILAFSFVLNRFGFSISAIFSTLGIGGLAFALAAKDTLSNLFGGITILIDNVFRMGDWVTIGKDEGTVAEIGLRSTTIRTFDNALITIPNSIVSVASVKNWNRRAVGRRIKMYVGVTYECNMDDLRQGIEDIRTMLREHSEISNPNEQYTSKNKRMHFKLSSREDTFGIKSTQLVYLDRYNDFSIDIMIYCFSKTVVWSEWLAVKEDVLFKIAKILEKNNLEFAYPTEVRINRSHALPAIGDAPLFNE